jgi:hypothetical protein
MNTIITPQQQLQRTYAAAGSTGDLAARMLVADRGPNWVRVLDSGRSLGQSAESLQHLTDESLAAMPDDGTLKVAGDFLHGASWHANKGLETVRGAVADALAGHEELQAQAAKLLDPRSQIAIPGDFNAFETATKHVDPQLLDAVGKAGWAGHESFEHARSDADQSRTWLREVAARMQS